MKKYAGIWIDREKAFVVIISEDRETIERIESGIAGRVRLSGGSRSRTIYGPQDVASERKIEEKRKHQFREYYRTVVDKIGDARKVFLFGPGEAKVELEKEIKNSKELALRVAGVEPADKMTENQIRARVREFFQL